MESHLLLLGIIEGEEQHLPLRRIHRWVMQRAAARYEGLPHLLCGDVGFCLTG